MKRKIFYLIMVLMFLPGIAAAEDDFQYWSQYSLKIYDGQKVDWVTFADTRFKEDASKLGVYYISERLTFDYFKNLQLGLNYTYLNTRSTAPAAADKEYKTHHRAEVEVNPYWNLTDWLKLKIRNRMEFRWVEDKGSHNTRYRQRWTLTVPLKGNPLIASIYTNGEFFYDIANHALNQNRMVPLGVRLKINEQAALNVYYMIQSSKGTKDWSSNQILGTVLSMTF